LGKPLLLSEYGRAAHAAGWMDRADFFSLMWQIVEDSVRDNHALRGDALWTVLPEGIGGTDQYAVYLSDSKLMSAFARHAATLKQLAGARSLRSGCKHPAVAIEAGSAEKPDR
jgi:hypothetical protein